MVGILFVCTGNICRSPTAEGMARALAGDYGLDGRITLDSAGTHGYHVGEPPDPRTVAAAAERGVDLSGQRARRVRDGDFQAFDLLVAMDRGHERLLRRTAPPAGDERIRLFMDYAPHLGHRDVPDPYYGGADGFELVLDLVEAAARGLLETVRRDHFPGGKGAR